MTLILRLCRLLKQALEVLHCAVVGIDCVIIGHIIAMIGGEGLTGMSQIPFTPKFCR